MLYAVHFFRRRLSTVKGYAKRRERDRETGYNDSPAGGSWPQQAKNVNIQRAWHEHGRRGGNNNKRENKKGNYFVRRKKEGGAGGAGGGGMQRANEDVHISKHVRARNRGCVSCENQKGKGDSWLRILDEYFVHGSP